MAVLVGASWGDAVVFAVSASAAGEDIALSFFLIGFFGPAGEASFFAAAAATEEGLAALAFRAAATAGVVFLVTGVGAWRLASFFIVLSTSFAFTTLPRSLGLACEVLEGPADAADAPPLADGVAEDLAADELLPTLSMAEDECPFLVVRISGSVLCGRRRVRVLVGERILWMLFLFWFGRGASDT